MEPGPQTIPGLVSVVVVNYRGARDTVACLEALAALPWPADRIEVICVDNGSGDGSLEAIRAAGTGAQVVDSGGNLGFAGGCNVGAALARGEYLALINNDARPDAAWVAAAVEVLETDPEVAGVASQVLDWDGTVVDFVDGAMTWFGFGYKPGVGEVPAPDAAEPRDVLFGTGSGVFFRTQVFRAVGGFDERFFMFFEDVDLGWRLNVLGHRVRYVPGSVVFHRHHASMRHYGRFRESYLLERNALLAMYKNYDDRSLAVCLPAALALAVRRSVADSGIDARMLDLQVRPGGDDDAMVTLPKDALAGPLAIDYLVEQLPTMAADREWIQSRRQRDDRDLFPLFRQPLEPAFALPSYLDAYPEVTRVLGVDQHFAGRRDVLIVTEEPLGPVMAGPGIRATEIARLLAAEHDVTLATLRDCALDEPGFRAVATTGRALRRLVDRSDVVVLQGSVLPKHPWIAEGDAVIVADVYDPFHLETLEQERGRSLDQRSIVSEATVNALNLQLSRADFLLCASEKQRDFWLGQLAGQGRVNPYTYDDDESLRTLIDVAPFGLPDHPPLKRRHGIRGTVPGIGPDDKVVLWGGGVYNWFDPLTLVSAVDVVRQTVPDVRLVFMGMKHPNPDVPAMSMALRTRELARELGLEGTHVFFNETWVPYADRADVLLDADVGVSCHFDHVETEFSFRTRILDYIWAGLPIVCTQGDAFGDLVAREGLGAAVPPEDVAALAAALVHLLDDPEANADARARVRRQAARFTWTRTLEPLARFVRRPRRAADQRTAAVTAVVGGHNRPRRPSFGVGDLGLAREYLAAGGVFELVRRARGRVDRVVRERS